MTGDLLIILVHIAGIVLLLFLSASFSASETALFSLSRIQVRRLAQKTGRAERAVSELLADPSRLLSTILVGNEAVNILYASLMGSLFHRLFGNAGLGWSVAISTFLLMICGEVTPKTIAARHPLVLARMLAIPVRFLSVVVTPIRWCLRRILSLLMLALGQGRAPSWGMLSREEIGSLLRTSEEEGGTSRKERELAENVLQLPLVHAKDIMVPRIEVKGVPDSLTLAEAYALACSHRHSRLPVYHETVDDIWGFLAILDLPRWRQHPAMERKLADFRTRGQAAPVPDSPVRPVHIFPETARVETLQVVMCRDCPDLTVLVDEYGGTAGMLTFQDILAEIAGRLAPVHVENQSLIVFAGTGAFVAGQALTRDLNRALGLDVQSENADTIGGYVMERLGRLPRAGDVVTDEALRFHVIKMAGRRVGAVRLERADGRPWREVERS